MAVLVSIAILLLVAMLVYLHHVHGLLLEVSRLTGELVDAANSQNEAISQIAKTQRILLARGDVEYGPAEPLGIINAGQYPGVGSDR